MEITAPKSRKICCFTTALLLIAIVIAAVCATLFLTILKPRPPEIIPHRTRLRNVTVALFPEPSLSASLNMTITIKNPNYGDCSYRNASAEVYYRDTPVTALPLQDGAVPARGQIDVVAHTNLDGHKVASSTSFLEDVGTGSLNFTAVAKMPVKVTVLKTFKFHVSVTIRCDMSVKVSDQSYDVLSTCASKLKI
ncbi:PREDICTED: uncharacterized protein LOC109146684 [Ipomoea nil]|uniref:uncharacterized protein LOC109146684 n=1 Tax=Ipomoea nil TaxID=35883 RepID=UPI000901D4B0|nr:PREDICTED: uncharacterized protein LOC109146684 [Ipomoea nil]